MTEPRYEKPEDVAAHADAMDAMRSTLASFRPEERLVIAAGVLGTTLCEVGPKPDRTAALMMSGIAMDMVRDMIDRTFPNEQIGES